MADARKQYTREFKHQAVRLVTEQGLSQAQAAPDLGLNDNWGSTTTCSAAGRRS